MTRYNCDKCKENVERYNLHTVHLGSLETKSLEELELCPHCLEQFRLTVLMWLKPPKPL